MFDSKTQINILLADDHSELDELLAEVFASFETRNIERIYKNLDLFWARLAMHIRAEHLHLFPAILNALKSQNQTKEQNIPTHQKAQKAIEQLKDDHNFFMRELSAAIKQLRDLLVADQTDVVNRLRDIRKKVLAVRNRLETHNESEETEVYKWADVLLQSTERALLNEKMEKEIGNLPPRFKPDE